MIIYTCARCNREMRCEENEVVVVHYMNNNRKDGVDELRFGDLWKCSECGSMVVLGFGKNIFGCDISDEMQKSILKNHQVIEVTRC